MTRCSFLVLGFAVGACFPAGEPVEIVDPPPVEDPGGGSEPPADMEPMDVPANDPAPPDAPMPPDAPPAATPDPPVPVPPPAARVITFGNRPGSMVRNALIDVELDQDPPGTNLARQPLMWVDRDDANVNNQVILFRFDLAAIPAGARVESATLRLVTDSDVNAGSQEPVDVHLVLERWSERDATWSDRTETQRWRSSGVRAPDSREREVLASFAPRARLTEYTIAIPAHVVQRWVDDPQGNLGIVLVNNRGEDAIALRASEHASDDDRPELEVRYVP